MIVVYLSLGIGVFINLSITDIILDRMVYKNGRIQPFLN